MVFLGHEFDFENKDVKNIKELLTIFHKKVSTDPPSFTVPFSPDERLRFEREGVYDTDNRYLARLTDIARIKYVLNNRFIHYTMIWVNSINHRYHTAYRRLCSFETDMNYYSDVIDFTKQFPNTTRIAMTTFDDSYQFKVFERQWADASFLFEFIKAAIIDADHCLSELDTLYDEHVTYEKAVTVDTKDKLGLNTLWPELDQATLAKRCKDPLVYDIRAIGIYPKIYTKEDFAYCKSLRNLFKDSNMEIEYTIEVLLYNAMQIINSYLRDMPIDKQKAQLYVIGQNLFLSGACRDLGYKSISAVGHKLTGIFKRSDRDQFLEILAVFKRDIDTLVKLCIDIKMGVVNKK